MLKINSVVVIGATGAVGKTVSGIFASFGDAKVYMVGRDISKLEKSKRDAALSVKSITVEENIIVKSMDELEECILDADFIFESVTENMDTKKEIHSRINNIVKKETIIATGTSGLSIDELACCYDEHKRGNFFGVHFFNPPYSMPLCELIPSKYNEGNKELIGKIHTLLKDGSIAQFNNQLVQFELLSGVQEGVLEYTKYKVPCVLNFGELGGAAEDASEFSLTIVINGKGEVVSQ